MGEGRPSKVLIVDDAPPVRMLLRSYLGKLGIRDDAITLAQDGEEGIAAFDAGSPDLVFVDIEMPKKGGEETATYMLGKRPDLRVIVMTAVEESDARVKQLRSWGVFAVLPKPVRLERVRELLDLIEEEQRNVQRIR